jgi:prepilin-type N-terminal cleavage/methylation domain-containing protein
MIKEKIQTRFSGLPAGRQGFTIIEVMIVLAIAGTILSIVFLAVPALQRGSRNTQRNGDSFKFMSAVNECLTNNNGSLASCQPSAAGTYDSATAPTPGTGPVLGSGGYLDLNKVQLLTTLRIYAPAATAAFPAATDTSSVYVFGGYTCSGNAFTSSNVGANSFVVLFNRETGGGGSTAACTSP